MQVAYLICLHSGSVNFEVRYNYYWKRFLLQLATSMVLKHREEKFVSLRRMYRIDVYAKFGWYGSLTSCNLCVFLPLYNQTVDVNIIQRNKKGTINILNLTFGQGVAHGE